MNKGRLALVSAAAMVALGLAGCSPHGYPATVLQGKSTGTNDTRTGISLEDGKRVGGPKFSFLDVDGPWVVGGARWYDGKTWHDGGNPPGPPCLDAGERIELGVVEVAATHDAGGWGVVAWVKCL
jgi:hypothetical protein